MNVGLGKHLRHDLGISFGRVRTATAGIAARAVIERLMAGETEETICADYGMPRAELQAAVEWMWRVLIAEEQRLRAKAEARRERKAAKR